MVNAAKQNRGTGKQLMKVNRETRILVVDDDAFVREMLATILESSGYLVETAEDGVIALEKYYAAPDIHLIVSDVNMPNMGGLQLIRELRQKNQEVPIIMVTSVSDVSVAVDAMGSGAIDYVLKDEGIEETINITVKRALAKHLLKLQNQQLIADLAAKSSELEDTLSYLTATINNMPDGLLVTNARSRITLANPALGRMFGVPEQELVGKDCQEVFSENLAPLLDTIRRKGDAGATALVELEGGRVGSVAGAAIFRKQEARGLDDECIGNLFIVRDVTSEKEIELMKDDFISIVSHELRTPLTSVIGFTRIINRKLEETIFPRLCSDEPKTVKTVGQISGNIQIIISEGERLTSLINDVLDLSKMEAGKIEWRYETVTIEDILWHARALTSSLFEKKGLRQVLEIEPGLPPLSCDKDRIVQVALNLLANALKFTDNGGVTVQAAKSAADRNCITVSVTDTGIGIAEAELAGVFEKFRQIGITLTDRPKGTGLGLPICKQIIEKHGGRIWAESRLDNGSTFFFELPVESCN
jgi:PAS domain S-box-containing protein